MSRNLPGTDSASISRMFDAIAEHYDVMNFVMTFGQDQRWRRQAAEVAGLREGDVALDVATGTGDLAFELASVVGRTGHVLAVDCVPAMLERARRKASRKGSPVSFETGDAHHLDYPDESFHAVTCGFGLRNMEHRLDALCEMRRIVRRRGKVVLLDLTPPTNLVAKAYLDRIVPRMGQVLANAREAYTYLPESVEHFPNAVALGHLMQRAGLREVSYRLLNFGTIALHWGTRPEV